jgi:hypothetical protein
MTFSPRPSFPNASRFLAGARLALAVAVIGLVSMACEDLHIGRPCDLVAADAGASGTGRNATINSQAVECPTRICLFPAADKISSVGPLCTADCSSDEDCEDGELGAKNTKKCNAGFVCTVPTTVGDFCCRKMCVCKDLIDTQSGDYRNTPEVCKAGQTMCKNVR